MLSHDLATDAVRVRRAAVLATAVLGAAPLAAAAAPRHDSTPARISVVASGVVYGGVTDDGFGLMVETNKSRRNIVRIATGLKLTLHVRRHVQHARRLEQAVGKEAQIQRHVRPDDRAQRRRDDGRPSRRRERQVQPSHDKHLGNLVVQGDRA